MGYAATDCAGGDKVAPMFDGGKTEIFALGLREVEKRVTSRASPGDREGRDETAPPAAANTTRVSNEPTACWNRRHQGDLDESISVRHVTSFVCWKLLDAVFAGGMAIGSALATRLCRALFHRSRNWNLAA